MVFGAVKGLCWLQTRFDRGVRYEENSKIIPLYHHAADQTQRFLCLYFGQMLLHMLFMPMYYVKLTWFLHFLVNTVFSFHGEFEETPSINQ